MQRLEFIPATLGALAIVVAFQANAQSPLDARIAAVREGVVRMQYDSRPGVCGDGTSMVGYRSAMFARDLSGFGRVHDHRCVTGPVRVSLVMSGGRVTLAQTQIGGLWPALGSPVVDLGVVPANTAASYFFARLGDMESTPSRDRLLLGAVLADAEIMAPLLAVARNEKRHINTRRQAIQWLGLLGDSSVIPALVNFTKGGVDNADDSHEGEGLPIAAMSALAMVEGGAGIPALIQLARNGPVAVRRNAVFWLAQNGDARGIRVVHTVIEDAKEDNRVRKHAIFSLGNSGEVPASEHAYLRTMFGRLDDDGLKEAVLQAVVNNQTDGGAWVLARAKDSHESVKVRKSALFWAGQGEGTSTSDIVAAYRAMDDRTLQEQAIFVISQRDDNAAVDALMKIAREDPDKAMRGKALFWLAQKHDARVTRMIGDLVLK